MMLLCLSGGPANAAFVQYFRQMLWVALPIGRRGQQGKLPAIPIAFGGRGGLQAEHGTQFDDAQGHCQNCRLGDETIFYVHRAPPPPGEGVTFVVETISPAQNDFPAAGDKLIVEGLRVDFRRLFTGDSSHEFEKPFPVSLRSPHRAVVR